MKNDLTCAVVGDLLPAYAEHLTAPETNEAVERHLAGCPDCAAKLSAMRAPEPEPEPEETAREVDYLKKVKRRGWLRVTLAIVLTLAVLLGALAAKVFVIGSPASADTMAVRTWTAGGQLWVEVTSSVSANAFWGWNTEVENGAAHITAREVIVSPIHPSAYGKIGVPLEGVEEVYLCGRLIWQDGAAITRETLDLMEAKTPYVGNASAVGRLIGCTEIPQLGGYTLSLQTGAEPYGCTVEFQTVMGTESRVDEIMERAAFRLLALVGNLSEVSWTYTDVTGEVHTGAVTEADYLPLIENPLPGYGGVPSPQELDVQDSLKDYTDTAAHFQRFCSSLDTQCGLRRSYEQNPDLLIAY